MPDPDPRPPRAQAPDPAADEVPGASAATPAPRRRLSARSQVGVAVLLALLGFAAVAQIRITREDSDFSGQRREDLIELLDSLSAATDRAQTQLDDLEATRDELRSSAERRQVAIDEARSRLEVLEVLTGTAVATGPGVTITVADPQSAVSAAVVLNAIEELRDAGAEAIEINDVVRVVASTSFTDREGDIVADGVALKPPYVIDAIGSSHTLSEAAVFPGGLADQVAELGGTVQVDEGDSLEVGSLHSLVEPEYSQPTDE